MKKLEKRATKSDPPKGAFGREVLAESLSESRLPKIQEALISALKELGLEGQVTVSEEKNLVTSFKVVVDGRERDVAIGNSVADAENPVAEVVNVLKMFGLGAR
ncbi:MAG TPA: hypothetical protein VLD37_00185 [Candidatus Bilamarchaeum sp.]|nr:hypothetical protein [Candidatus Bilamarchaeum sp.]